MGLEKIEALIESPGDERVIDIFLNDTERVFWVDWREDESEIPNLCQATLKEPIAVEFNKGDGDAFFTIVHADRTVSPRLSGTPRDKLTTLLSLNELFKGHYEIRLSLHTVGNDTLGFCNLRCEEWVGLENSSSDACAQMFMPLKDALDPFLDLMAMDFVQKYFAILGDSHRFRDSIFTALEPAPTWEELSKDPTEKLTAVRLFATQHGCSMAEAKKAVDTYIGSNKAA